MPKSDAIDALMESAISHFAQDGFEGASLRDIAQEAGVPLSTIDRYFGSKSSLFVSVLRKVWSEVERDRDQAFEAALQASPGQPLALTDLICVLARPIVRRALSKQSGDLARTLLLRAGRPEEVTGRHSKLPELTDSDRHLARWLDAIAATCPDLTRRDVVWAFSFLSGLIYSRQLIDRRFSRFLTAPDEPDPEEVTRDIVAFGEAGILALIDRRAKDAALEADQSVIFAAAARSSRA